MRTYELNPALKVNAWHFSLVGSQSLSSPNKIPSDGPQINPNKLDFINYTSGNQILVFRFTFTL